MNSTQTFDGNIYQAELTAALAETGTTNLIDAYAEVCDAVEYTEAVLADSFVFLPASDSRVVVCTRRDAMEYGIRADLRAALLHLHNVSACITNELGWETIEQLHYYGA